MIKEEYYIRWTDDSVEIAESPDGPWKATLDVSGESWTGSFLLVRTVENSQTSERVTMSAQDTSIETPDGDLDVVSVSAGYSNATEEYVLQVYTIRSRQYFSKDQPSGLVRSTSYRWYQEKTVDSGSWGQSLEKVTIDLAGYEIPQPDGSILSGGDLDFSYAPSPPEDLSVTNPSAGFASLSWSPASDIASGFKIERRTGIAGTWEEIGEAEASTGSYTDTELVAKNQYYYRVRTYNFAGESEPSNEAYRTPALPPAVPSNLTAVVSDPPWYDVTLTWNDNSDDEAGFELEKATVEVEIP